MRIVVNDIAASSGGALSILKGFYNFIKSDELSQQHEWIFLLSDNYVNEMDNIKVLIYSEIKKSWFNRLKFELIDGKKEIESLHPDIVVSFQNTITFGLKVPQIVYMHQSLPFQKEKTFSLMKKRERLLAVYQHIIGRIIKQSIQKADHTIVQTNWIKEAVIKQVGISEKKISNVLPPINLNHHRDNSIFDKSLFFYPANGEIYKNHVTLFKAIEILEEEDKTEFQIIVTVDEEDYSDKRIKFTGYIDYESVLEYYGRSTLVFPSYIETIGLPLLEAKAAGTIILAADTPFAREALDGYENAYFFNKFDEKELANLMNDILENKITKKSTTIKDLTARNSWEEVVEIILKVAQ